MRHLRPGMRRVEARQPEVGNDQVIIAAVVFLEPQDVLGLDVPMSAPIFLHEYQIGVAEVRGIVSGVWHAAEVVNHSKSFQESQALGKKPLCVCAADRSDRVWVSRPELLKVSICPGENEEVAIPMPVRKL